MTGTRWHPAGPRPRTASSAARRTIAAAALAACASMPAAASARVHAVAPGAPLERALAVAAPGDTLRLARGTWAGGVTIDRPVTLLGDGDAVIDGGGRGTVITVKAPRVVLEGLVLRSSGLSLSAEDAVVTILADSVRVERCRIEKALFGVYLRKARGCVVRDNDIAGHPELDVARRGDLVRAWYSAGTRIENNRLRRGRDLIVWFSDGSVVRGNTVTDARYGVHLMYDNDCVIERNRLLRNSVGIYLMYSRRLQVKYNTVAYNRGANGFGIGVKDVDDSNVQGNLIVDNRVGVFVDNSPRDIDSHMEYADDIIAWNDQGMRLAASVERTRVRGCAFRDNYEDVAVPGGVFAPKVDWYGNAWSRYNGYDADGDGVGDLPYRSQRFFENVIARNPRLRLFVYSPAMQALDLAARIFPVMQPEPKLTDPAPRMRARVPDEAPAVARHRASPLAAAALAALALGVAVTSAARLDGGAA